MIAVCSYSDTLFELDKCIEMVQRLHPDKWLGHLIERWATNQTGGYFPKENMLTLSAILTELRDPGEALDFESIEVLH